MIINRIWAMPNKNTFSIKPVRELIVRWFEQERLWGKITIDPFANSSKIAKITNDLDPQYETDYNMDALDFLKMMDTSNIDGCLYDPPWTPRQVAECYKKFDKTVNMETTQASFWGNLKKELGRIIKPNRIVISCGYNSGGIGKSNGFEIEEILLVPHGGNHNDTIITVERKVR